MNNPAGVSQPRSEGELEQNINRLGQHRENLSSLVARMHRIASELLGPVPPDEKSETAKDKSPGLMGTLSSTLDDTEKVTREMQEVIERMERLA